MLYIDEAKIENILADAKNASSQAIDAILAKSKSLTRLNLCETAALLAAEDPSDIQKIFQAAYYVKNAIYGRRIVIFAPLYISNICANACLYCAFKADNSLIVRRALTMDEIGRETEWLLKRGHKRILLVAGEAGSSSRVVDYYVDAVKAVYAANIGPNRIRRVNVNCAPLTTDEFRKLKTAGIGTYQLFQETYHDKTYRLVHPAGPKSDPDNRLDAIDRAFCADIDDVGIGVLYGLYGYRFETLALLMHIEHLEKKFGIGPHTISVPRIEPALGSNLSRNVPHRLSDEEFKKVVAVLRLAVPYTGIILSTRESAGMRDQLFSLGVSQISAESKTSPGGYSIAAASGDNGTQFELNDSRTLDEIAGSLIGKGFIPSFCAACYRKERTGDAFMNLAKPGVIKDACSMNALITLKEYLDDFASEKVRREGYRLIDSVEKDLDPKRREYLSRFFAHVEQGVRDEYV